ncbi:MAG: hypothetical protein LBS67_01960, partial [Clostridiales Family XIII bacterium]|nr:hypothetical protein [Clostridiales Family XIII bacterium]
MKNFGVLFRNGLLRSKGILIIALAVSLGVMGISILASTLGSGDAGTPTDSIKLGFMDGDSSALSDDMRTYFQDGLGVELVETGDRDELDSELVNKHISGIAEVPEGFQSALLAGDPVPVDLTFTDDYANKAFVNGYFESYLASASVLAAAADGDAAVFERMLTEADRLESDVEIGRGDAELARREAQKEGFWFML